MTLSPARKRELLEQVRNHKRIVAAYDDSTQAVFPMPDMLPTPFVADALYLASLFGGDDVASSTYGELEQQRMCSQYPPAWMHWLFFSLRGHFEPRDDDPYLEA